MAILSADQGAPARQWKAIVPSDSANIANCRAIYVGGAGDIVLVGSDDATATFTAVPAGVILPCGAKRVNLTGTTATLLLALF